MRYSLSGLLGMAILSFSMAPAASAQDAPVAYIVSYVEVAPAAKAQARALIAKFARDTRKEPGNLQFIAMQRISEPNHFAIVEAWKDKDAQAAHNAGATAQAFHAAFEPLQRSPYDERPHSALNVAAPSGSPGKGAVYVVTHVDIVPTSKDAGLELSRGLADDSRKDDGSLRFDALQQNSRLNHVTLVEIWKNPKAVEAHGISEHMKEFRKKFFPISGGLYDERIYKSID
jgi:quinol monooxygenase YgiN